MKKGFKVSEETKKKISLSLKEFYSQVEGKRPFWIDVTPGPTHAGYKHGLSRTKEYKKHYERVRRHRLRGTTGSFSFVDWREMKEQYNFTCPCCKRKEPDIVLTIDHITPIARGGSNSIENIQPLCFDCNNKKQTKIIKYDY